MKDMETRTETQDMWRHSGRPGNSADYTEKKLGKIYSNKKSDWTHRDCQTDGDCDGR